MSLHTVRKFVREFPRQGQVCDRNKIFPSRQFRAFTSNQKHSHYDVTIVGGGAVGSVLANLLSEYAPSLKVSLMDARTPKKFEDSININGPTELFPSPRAYALSPKSLKLLGGDVMDKLLRSGRISFYDSMQVWESDGPAILQFNHDDLDPCDKIKFDNGKNDILGAVVEDEPMVSCIWDKLRHNGEVDLISPVAIKNISQPNAESDDSKVKIEYESSDAAETGKISTNLLVAADGGNSFVRRTLGSFPTVSFAYGRKAVTCTVEIDESIGMTAFQRFQPNGPIALLPVWDEDVKMRTGNCGNKIYANIVWSTTPEEAKTLMSLTEEDFVNQMNNLLQAGPTNAPPLVSDEMKKIMPRPLESAVNGLEMLSQSVNNGLTISGMTERRIGFTVPPKIVDVVGRRFAFDLNLMHAKNYVSSRVALVGDAAHTIHPMAGQGLNLGMGDVECLALNLKQAVESGMGVDGSAGLDYALQQYQSARQREVVATMGGIQFLHAAFGTTFSPAIHVRSVGMNMINSVGPLRRRLVQVATGVEGIS